MEKTKSFSHIDFFFFFIIKKYLKKKKPNLRDSGTHRGCFFFCKNPTEPFFSFQFDEQWREKAEIGDERRRTEDGGGWRGRGRGKILKEGRRKKRGGYYLPILGWEIRKCIYVTCNIRPCKKKKKTPSPPTQSAQTNSGHYLSVCVCVSLSLSPNLHRSHWHAPKFWTFRSSNSIKSKPGHDPSKSRFGTSLCVYNNNKTIHTVLTTRKKKRKKKILRFLLYVRLSSFFYLFKLKIGHVLGEKRKKKVQGSGGELRRGKGPDRERHTDAFN